MHNVVSAKVKAHTCTIMASAAFADDVAAYLIDYEANHELQLTEDRLFNSKKGSDITVVCRGRSWYAHRSVICVQSDLLEKACDNVLKVDTTVTPAIRAPADAVGRRLERTAWI